MTTLEKIAAIRRLMNEVADSPDVLALASSGTHHPNVRIGDCIEAFDDLVYALRQFLTKPSVPNVQPLDLTQLEAMQEVIPLCHLTPVPHAGHRSTTKIL